MSDDSLFDIIDTDFKLAEIHAHNATVAAVEADGEYIAELVEQVRKWKLAWQESTDREIELKARIATLEAELLAARDLLAGEVVAWEILTPEGHHLSLQREKPTPTELDAEWGYTCRALRCID